MQGNLVFATTETAVHEVLKRSEELDFLVLDFGHVLSINDPAARLLFELTQGLVAEGKTFN